MPANRLENPRQPEEAVANGHAGNGASPANSGGGFKNWLPLLANIILMPAIAYALTVFVLIPKLGVASPTAASGSPGPAPGGSTGSKITANLSGKVLVNVAGTMGTRYLVASITLVGTQADFKMKVEQSDHQLRDAASGILAVKTISDLEKPGMRNLIRMELLSAFNDILGPDSVSEIYLTEFAVQ